MPYPAQSGVSMTISAIAPVGAPPVTIANKNANQAQIRLVATGSDVTLAPGANVNMLWFYIGAVWHAGVTSWIPEGITVTNGYGFVDVLRWPVDATGVHLQCIGATSLENLAGSVVPIDGGA